MLLHLRLIRASFQRMPGPWVSEMLMQSCVPTQIPPRSHPTRLQRITLNQTVGPGRKLNSLSGKGPMKLLPVSDVVLCIPE